MRPRAMRRAWVTAFVGTSISQKKIAKESHMGLWRIGRASAFHAGDPGSIPHGDEIFFPSFHEF